MESQELSLAPDPNGANATLNAKSPPHSPDNANKSFAHMQFASNKNTSTRNSRKHTP